MENDVNINPTEQEPVKSSNQSKPKIGRPLKFKDAESLKMMEEAFDKYIKEVQSESSFHKQTNNKTGVVTKTRTPAYYGSFLTRIGTSYEVIRPYEDGEHDDIADFSSFLARVKQLCEEDIIDCASNGWIANERLALAILSRHHRFSEKVDVNSSVSGTMTLEFTGVLNDWAK